MTRVASQKSAEAPKRRGAFLTARQASSTPRKETLFSHFLLPHRQRDGQGKGRGRRKERDQGR